MTDIFKNLLWIALIFSVLAAILSTGVQAGTTTCHYDYFGRYVCEDGYGYRSETKQDYFGHDITTDNRGNRIDCHHDYFGRYVCDKQWR